MASRTTGRVLTDRRGLAGKASLVDTKFGKKKPSRWHGRTQTVGEVRVRLSRGARAASPSLPLLRFGPACPSVAERPRGIRARSSVAGTRWVSEYHSPFQSRYHKTQVRRAGLCPEEAA